MNPARFSPILCFAFLYHCLLCCTDGLQFYKALFVNCWPYALSSQIPILNVWSCASLLQCVSYSFLLPLCSILGCTFKALVQLALIYKVRDEDLAEFPYMLHLHLSQHPLLERLSFLLCLLFAIFVKNQVTIIVWTYIWVLCSVTLIYMSDYDSTLPFLLPWLRSISWGWVGSAPCYFK